MLSLSTFSIHFTMTVIPERLESSFFKLVIRSLKEQTFAFDRIVLNIPEVYARTNSRYSIPEWVRADEDIYINRCDDLGPATKLLGYYSSFASDDIVCVVDDDIVYLPQMLENLISRYRHHPQAVVTTFKDHHGSPTGFSGYLFRKGILDITNEDLDELFCYCYLVDDTWLGKICRAKGVDIVALSGNWLASMNQQATDTHPDWYELIKNTSRDDLVQHCLNGELTREGNWLARFLRFFTLTK